MNEDFRVVRAIDAATYFGLTDLAAFCRDLLRNIDDEEYIESRFDAYDDLIAGGDAIEEAFRAKVAANPQDFATAGARISR